MPITITTGYLCLDVTHNGESFFGIDDVKAVVTCYGAPDDWTMKGFKMTAYRRSGATFTEREVTITKADNFPLFDVICDLLTEQCAEEISEACATEAGLHFATPRSIDEAVVIGAGEWRKYPYRGGL